VWWKGLDIAEITRDERMTGARDRRGLWPEIGLPDLPLVFVVFPIAVAHAGGIIVPFILDIGLDRGRVQVVACCVALERLWFFSGMLRMLEML
jgi:hypothetical protein